jgi:hypothetical protein
MAKSFIAKTLNDLKSKYFEMKTESDFHLIEFLSLEYYKSSSLKIIAWLVLHF